MYWETSVYLIAHSFGMLGNVYKYQAEMLLKVMNEKSKGILSTWVGSWYINI